MKNVPKPHFLLSFPISDQANGKEMYSLLNDDDQVNL
jgi:hypothetical protein